MKLLIVDDYPGVVQGLVQGVDWDGLGITEVLTAQNAMQALDILRAEDPDIMLCDIEMPQENGLQLFQRMRVEKIGACCIFLTSHAEFEYAQKALKLGAFDYIVQPAPYAEVRRVVQKAISYLQSEAEKDKVYGLGKVFSKQVYTIAVGVQREFLIGSQNLRELNAMTELDWMPAQNKTCGLVLLQLVRWNSLTQKMEPPLFAFALNNIMSEIFTPPWAKPVVTPMEGNTFSLILQNDDIDDMNGELLSRQFSYFCSVCEQYLFCSFACYLAPLAPMKDLPQKWSQLCTLRDDNVALNSGVFFADSAKANPPPFHMPKIQHWSKLLHEGYSQAMQAEAFSVLDSMVVNDRMNAVTLRHFYQDFLQMLYGALESSNEKLMELFNGPEALEIYRNGMKTVDHMKELIRYVATCYRAEPDALDQKNIVHQVMEYIDTHLESDLRREELAAYVHMNADYLTRIFKKETGLTLKDYITRQKMRESQSLLRTTNLPVGFIAAKLGYCNFSHFSFMYKKIMGVTPLEERRLTEEDTAH